MGCCESCTREGTSEDIEAKFSSKTQQIKVQRAEYLHTSNSLKPEYQLTFNSIKINKQNFVQYFEGDITQFYSLQQQLGDGAFGRVFKGRHRQSGNQRAIKIIRKDRVDPSKQAQLYNEVQILKGLDHPYIIPIYQVIQNSQTINIATQLCTGGELFQRIVAYKYFSQNYAAHYIFQIMFALVYCHKNGIVHRDLKPQNILFENTSIKSPIKVIDFGTSKKLEKNKTFNNFIGTAYYVAPEVIEGAYDEKCDIWSCGVILYILLSGKPPFGGKTQKEIFSKITKSIYTFQAPCWSSISAEAKQLIRLMLTRDPAQRPSAQQIINHPWIQNRSSQIIEDNILTHQTLKSLANFTAVWKIKQATLNFIASQLVTAQEIHELRKIFVALDADNDGTLSIEEIREGFQKLGLSGTLNMEEIIDNCDSDRNGVIEYTEFLTATLNWQKTLSQERVEAAFKAYDTDGSGTITYQELKNFIGDKEIENEVWQLILQEADLNHDGFIDLEEFKILMLKQHGV